MKKLLFTGALMQLVCVGLIAQTITGVVVTNPAPPADITECDQVEITINGTFPATNFTNTNFIPDFNGYDLDYNLYAESSGSGSAVITPFSEPVPTLGFFSPPGNYNLTIFFYNNNVLVDSFLYVMPVLMGTDPDPGQDSLINICNTDPQFNLFDILGGTPEPGGEWTDPNNNVHSGMFNPQSDPAGLYIYTLLANPPCNTTFSGVTVFFIANSNPGTNGNAFLCELDPPTDLFSYLGGGPQTGGTWTNPSNQPHSGMFDPSVDPPGNYKYTVAGMAPCGDPWAFVNVQLKEAAQPGDDNSITVNDNDPPFMLYDHLLGDPDTNGFWVDPNNINFGSWDAMMNPALDFPGVYKYVGVALPCPNDTAFLDVEILVGINEQDPNISAFNIIPNPNSGQFQLDVQFREAAEKYELEVVSLTGQTVLSESLSTVGRTSFKKNMDLSEMPKGVYFLRMSSPNVTTVKRMVLE